MISFKMKKGGGTFQLSASLFLYIGQLFLYIGLLFLYICQLFLCLVLCDAVYGVVLFILSLLLHLFCQKVGSEFGRPVLVL